MDAGAGLAPGVRRRRLGAWQIAGILAGVVVLGAAVGVFAHLLSNASGGQSPAAKVKAPSHTATLPAAGLLGEATWAAGARPAPPITTLRDQSGHLFSLASLRGRTVAIEFFDSHCHQECPLAGRTLADAERTIPRAQRPVLVVVSVNPKDTPASARAAAREWGLAAVAPWHWLMGTHAELARVWKAYRISVQPAKGDISHTEALYLLDGHGDERSGYLYPYLPRYVAHDMRLLAATGRRS